MLKAGRVDASSHSQVLSLPSVILPESCNPLGGTRCVFMGTLETLSGPRDEFCDVQVNPLCAEHWEPPGAPSPMAGLGRHLSSAVGWTFDSRSSTLLCWLGQSWLGLYSVLSKARATYLVHQHRQLASTGAAKERSKPGCLFSCTKK